MVSYIARSGQSKIRNLTKNTLTYDVKFSALASKEVDKWSVYDLKKMINWNKVKADSATPARKKDLLLLWDLVRGRPEPTPPKRSEEEMDMDGGIVSEVNGNLCEGDKQHQATSVLIWVFCVDHVDILRTVKYLSL